MITENHAEKCGGNLDFRTLGDELPLMLFVCHNGKVTYVNKQCAGSTGYSVDEILSPEFSFDTLITRGSLSTILKNFELKLAGEEVPDLEFSINTKDGKEKSAVMSLRLIDCNGDKAILAIVTDVTELRSAVKKFTSIESRFRSIVEHMTEGLVTQDKNRVITYANPRVCEMLGYAPDEIIGKPVSIMFDEGNMKIIDAEFQKRARGIGSSYEAGWRRKDGTNVDTYISGRPLLDENGEFDGSMGVFTDITELKKKEKQLKESEERFRMLLEQMPQMIFIYNPKGKGSIMYMNPQTAKVSGYTAEEMTSPDFDVLSAIAPDFHDVYERNRRLREAGKELPEQEMTLLTKNGTPVDVNIITKNIRYLNEPAVLYIASDITELKRSNEQKKVFIASLAHELRNPLAALQLTMQLLHEHVDRASQGAASSSVEAIDVRTLKEIADTALSHIGGMSHMLGDLLDIARIDTGKMHLKMDVLDLVTTVRSSVETIRPDIVAKNILLTLDLPPKPIFMSGDDVRLRQVVINLVANAYKYTPPGGHIWVTVAEEKEKAVIRVKDNGMGILAEHLPHIFEQFYRSKDAAKKADTGLGMGLTLVRTICDLHGGVVAAHSEGAQKGSEFIVQLPVASEGAPAKSAQKDDPLPAAAKEKVLIVDDNRDLANALAKLLGIYGFEVHTCYDGRSALAEAESFDPDAIVLDISLPDMDGYEIARSIRSRDKGKKKQRMIIAASGYGQADDIERSKAAGCDHHLVKPVDVAELRTLLANAGRR